MKRRKAWVVDRETQVPFEWITYESRYTPGAEVADLSLPVVVSVHRLAPKHNNMTLFNFGRLFKQQTFVYKFG